MTKQYTKGKNKGDLTEKMSFSVIRHICDKKSCKQQEKFLLAFILGEETQSPIMVLPWQDKSL